MRTSLRRLVHSLAAPLAALVVARFVGVVPASADPDVASVLESRHG
jgi:hypothetical protein